MATSLNAGKSFDSDQEFKRIEGLTDEQNDLLEEIDQLFRPEQNDADRCILYEVTHYQHESATETFWSQYDDYSELGCDKLVNDKRMDAGAVIKKRDKRYCCGLIKAGGRLDTIATAVKQKTKGKPTAPVIQAENEEPILLQQSDDDDDYNEGQL